VITIMRASILRGIQRLTAAFEILELSNTTPNVTLGMLKAARDGKSAGKQQTASRIAYMRAVIWPCASMSQPNWGVGVSAFGVTMTSSPLGVSSSPSGTG
jgi:hypothetical protein